MATDFSLVRQLTVATLSEIVELQETVAAGRPVGFIRSKTDSQDEVDGVHLQNPVSWVK